jgi:hypothetical protein
VSRVGVRVDLRSPALLASAPPASNQLETLRLIPGNTLRGVMARRYLDLGNEAEGGEFRRLFLSGEVRFGFATCKGAEVLPLSARSCKYVPGFRGEGHGVSDLLLPDRTGEACPECGRALDYHQGFWYPGAPREATVKTRLVTRTAIDPVRATAKKGQLYSQRVLSEGQSFLAAVEAPEDLAPRLVEMLDGGFSAVVGTGGSRGQGWAEVSLAELPETGRGEAKARAEHYRDAMKKPVLAVTLLSDGLFQDDYLRDSTAPSLCDLQGLEIEPDDWHPQPARAFLDVRQVFGFDGLPIRLPRPPRFAVAAGSAFLYEAREGREPKIPEGEGTGWIGGVNGEGYGRAVLWHPFHLDPEGGEP